MLSGLESRLVARGGIAAERHALPVARVPAQVKHRANFPGTHPQMRGHRLFPIRNDREPCVPRAQPTTMNDRAHCGFRTAINSHSIHTHRAPPHGTDTRQRSTFREQARETSSAHQRSPPCRPAPGNQDFGSHHVQHADSIDSHSGTANTMWRNSIIQGTCVI